MQVGPIITFIIFFIIPVSIQAKTFWRWQFDLGHQQSRYSEKKDGQSFEGSRFDQKSIVGKVGGEWLVFPKWFSLGGDLEYLTPLSSEKDFDYSMLRQSSRASLILNSRPFHLSLVAEQFYQDFQASDASFGYESINGTHMYPRLDFSLDRGSRFYLQSPLVSNLEGHKLIIAGFELRLTGQEAPFPVHLFQYSPLLKFEYINEELDFKETPEVNIKTESFTLSLSFNF